MVCLRLITVATSVATVLATTLDHCNSIYDVDDGTITTTCADGRTKVTKDRVNDEHGRIVPWSDAAGVPIGDRLWTTGAPGSAAEAPPAASAARLQGPPTLPPEG